MFKETNRTAREQMFAIKLFGNTAGITESELIDLFKILRKRNEDYFKYSKSLYNNEIKGGAIVDKKNDRVIMVSPESIEYREVKKFNKEEFNSICRYLYDFYKDIKKVEPKEIRLIGKVFNFSFIIDRNAVDLLKEKTGFLRSNPLFEFEIKTLFRKDDYHNIHLRILTKVAETEIERESGIDEKNVIVVLDINNKNQEDGLDLDSMNKIVTFADEYNRTSLLSDLNEYFSE